MDILYTGAHLFSRHACLLWVPQQVASGNLSRDMAVLWVVSCCNCTDGAT